MAPIDLFHGSITTLDVDAIVNAANPQLCGGGGVDEAIHRAAGPRLLSACLALAVDPSGVRCPTGEARITSGFDLPARYVIHTVGPVWRNRGDEPDLLAACYRSCLALAQEQKLTSIAFPAISTGVYGFPKALAAQIAVRELRLFLGSPTTLQRVLLVAFSVEDLRCYEHAAS
jgi:O-acetyl-ADP-ribose deacetylase